MSYASGMAIGLTIGQQLLSLFAQNQAKGKGNGFNANAFNSDSSGFNFAELGKEINSINKEIEQQSVRLVHAIKGRRRYYVDALKQNSHLAKLVTTKLKELSFIKEVKANINTGSLLILYSCAENLIDDIFLQLKQRVFNVSSKIARLGSNASSFASTTFVSIIKEINAWLKARTNNLFDLRGLVAGLFIVRGLRKILSGQRPNGPQMLWWAFSLLKGIDR